MNPDRQITPDKPGAEDGLDTLNKLKGKETEKAMVKNIPYLTNIWIDITILPLKIHLNKIIHGMNQYFTATTP